MNTKRWFSFGTKATSPSLAEVDDLYRKAIAPLNEEMRLDYCQRLLCRAEYFIKHTDQKNKIKQLKELAEAANNEISQLRGR